MNPRCQSFSSPQASAERNFGLQSNLASTGAGANAIYAGTKKEAVYAYRTNTHAANIAKA